MAIFLLIRHGANDLIGKSMAGRRPGIHLNEEGRRQAEDLAEQLAEWPIARICSSPMERTRETAEPLARRLDQEVRICEDFNEFAVGEWEGRPFAELEKDPRWRQFNSFRSGTHVPQGELQVQVQARMVSQIERIREESPDGITAIFSHGDPIKSVIAHYAGIPLDFVLRLEVSLASVSMLAVEDWGPRILCLNHTGKLPFFLLGENFP